MFYLEEACSVCESGLLGFLTCKSGDSVVICCDECGAIWLDPGDVAVSKPVFPQPPRFFLPGFEISVAGSEWSSYEEIKFAGMLGFFSFDRMYEP